MRLKPIALSFLALIAPSAASADMSGPFDGGGWMVWMGIDPLSNLLNERDRNSRNGDQGAPASPGGGQNAASGTSPASLASLHYTPSIQRRKQNLASFVDKTRASDPAGAREIETLFNSGDIIEMFGKELAPVGLRTDNLADAYAVWWINCWSAVHGDTSTPDRTTAMAVKAQASRALIAAGKVGTANDSLKQQFSEALLVQALLLDAGLQQAKGNPQQLRIVAEAANKGAKGMGLDLTTMRLTPQGFVPAG